MRTCLWMAALAAVLLPVAAAASPGASGGLLQNPCIVTPLVSVTPTAVVAAAPPTLALATPFVGGIGYGAPAQHSGGSVMPVTTQLHAGFFDPADDFSSGFVGGFRMGPQVDPHVQIGLAMDWWHKSESTTMRLGGGGTEKLVLSTVDADLLPVLAFVQVRGDENLPIIPYGGVGVGYEWLFLSSYDYRYGYFDETLGGFGWQVWGGIGIPLNGRTRVVGEVFYDGSEVSSDVEVFSPEVGYAVVRHEISMNGVGMRFGISWGF